MKLASSEKESGVFETVAVNPRWNLELEQSQINP